LALPTPLEFTSGCCAPGPACGTTFFSLDLDSLAVDASALAVPIPLLAAAPAPTPVAGPAGSVVLRGAGCKRVLEPLALGSTVELFASAVAPCRALGEALLSFLEQPATAKPTATTKIGVTPFTF